MLNEDIAYLLGMICGNGTIRRDNRQTQVTIDIPHKNLTIEGENTQQSIRASILDIKTRLDGFIGANLTPNTSNTNRAHISFIKDNDDYLIRTINQLMGGYTSWRDFRIPKEIFEGSKQIRIEFLRGFSDVTGYIRKSNQAWSDYENRVYLEIMSNWDICIDIANLLKSLDVPVQTIRFAHPNIVDPKLKKYNEGKKEFWNKEHQIKIWAEEFEIIGFNVDHKNNLLKKYSALNRSNWDKSEKKKKIEESHHKFYWQTKNIKKTKPDHPKENSLKISSKIRGTHFDSWKRMAEMLGYGQ